MLTDNVVKILTVIFSLPVVVLLIILIFNCQIRKLLKIIIEKLKISNIEKINLPGFGIELSQIKEKEFRELSTLDFLLESRKGGINELLSSIEELFETPDSIKALTIYIDKNVYFYLLYLYILRLNRYSDLRLIIFLSEEKSFLGSLDIRSLIFLIEKQYPILKIIYSRTLLEHYRYIEHLEFSEHTNRNREIGIMSLERHLINDYINRIKNENDQIKHEKLDSSNYARVFLSKVKREYINRKDILTKKDVIKFIEFKGDFIPIVHEDIYKGVIDKNSFMQVVMTAILSESR